MVEELYCPYCKDNYNTIVISGHGETVNCSNCFRRYPLHTWRQECDKARSKNINTDRKDERIKELEAALRPFAVDEVEGMAGYTNIDACRCKVTATFGDVRAAKKALGIK